MKNQELYPAFKTMEELVLHIKSELQQHYQKQRLYLIHKSEAEKNNDSAGAELFWNNLQLSYARSGVLEYLLAQIEGKA